MADTRKDDPPAAATPAPTLNRDAGVHALAAAIGDLAEIQRLLVTNHNRPDGTVATWVVDWLVEHDKHLDVVRRNAETVAGAVR